MKKINLILVSITLACLGCGSDDNGNSQPVNQPPSAVVLEFPGNNVQGIDKNVSFTYDVPEGDPEGDTITYDIYLNNGTEELLIAENHNQESFTYNEPLGLNRNYTWRVVAKDANGAQTESEIFSFKTRKATYESVPANYIARRHHTAELFNNELVILGGSNADGDVFNLRSSSDGELWNPIPIYPEERRHHTSIVFNDKLWVFGGISSSNGYLTSIYNISDISSGSGETWSVVDNTEGLLPRVSHTQVVLNDKMYIMAGVVGEFQSSSEVWSSSDGEAWQLKNADAPFGDRTGHTSVVFDNKIWLIGGAHIVTPLSDVWYSENGTDWTMATEQAAFGPRGSHASVVYDNKIWVYGGRDDNDNILGDLWYSEDGVTWHEAKFESTGTGEFPIGLQHASLVVKDDIMYVIGGRDNIGDYIDYTIKIQ